MIRMRYLAMAFTLALTACASAPMHYYTLIAPATATTNPVSAPATFQFELLPVGIPPQNDQPQLVVRQGDQGVAVLDGERWVAPLNDEIHGALSADLSRDMNAADVSGIAPSSKRVLQVKVDVHRFDSFPGNYALIEATWTVRMSGGHRALACTSRVSETVSAGYDQLVAGHQRALAELADQIASVAPAVATGGMPPCPSR